MNYSFAESRLLHFADVEQPKQVEKAQVMDTATRQNIEGALRSNLNLQERGDDGNFNQKQIYQKLGDSYLNYLTKFKSTDLKTLIKEYKSGAAEVTVADRNDTRENVVRILEAAVVKQELAGVNLSRDSLLKIVRLQNTEKIQFKVVKGQLEVALSGNLKDLKDHIARAQMSNSPTAIEQALSNAWENIIDAEMRGKENFKKDKTEDENAMKKADTLLTAAMRDEGEISRKELSGANLSPADELKIEQFQRTEKIQFKVVKGQLEVILQGRVADAKDHIARAQMSVSPRAVERALSNAWTKAVEAEMSHKGAF